MEKVNNDQLNGSEALYGFVGWLTSREPRVTMSSSNDATLPVNLVSRFCKENNLTDPRDGWEKNLITPNH